MVVYGVNLVYCALVVLLLLTLLLKSPIGGRSEV